MKIISGFENVDLNTFSETIMCSVEECRKEMGYQSDPNFDFSANRSSYSVPQGRDNSQANFCRNCGQPLDNPLPLWQSALPALPGQDRHDLMVRAILGVFIKQQATQYEINRVFRSVASRLESLLICQGGS